MKIMNFHNVIKTACFAGGMKDYLITSKAEFYLKPPFINKDDAVGLFQIK